MGSEYYGVILDIKKSPSTLSIWFYYVYSVVEEGIDPPTFGL